MEQQQLIDFINEKLETRQMKKSDLLRLVNLDFKSGYKYLNGERKIKRNLLIKICIIFEMSVEEIQQLFLKSYVAQLYSEASRDAIIIEGINNKQTIEQINEALAKNNCEIL